MHDYIIISVRKDINYMVIDNFIERIIEDNEEIMFGKDNISNKEFLDSANDCANNYCKCMEVPIDDFRQGKELFKTIEYFTSKDFCDTIFKGLNDDDKKRADSFLKEITSVIEKEKTKGTHFDADAVCKSIMDYAILLSSIKIENYDEVSKEIEKVKKGEMEYKNIQFKKTLSGFDKEDILISDIKKIYQYIDDMESVQAKRDILCRPSFLVRTIRKTAQSTKSEKATATVFALVSLLPAIALAALLRSTDAGKVGAYLGSICFFFLLDPKWKQRNEMNKLLYRFEYWEIIMTACYNYYCKNYGGGING